MSASLPSSAWIDAVCACLRTCDRKRIIVRTRALLDWEATFFDAFLSDLYRAMDSALRSPVLEAKRVVDMAEPGETYAFFFYHRNRKLYGKICLQTDGKVIIIYSAHPPKWQTL